MSAEQANVSVLILSTVALQAKGYQSMGRVTVTLNNRIYRLACGDGEEARLQLLSDHVKAKIDALTEQFGQAGENRLLLMAALLIADELFEARERADADDPSEPPASSDAAPAASSPASRIAEPPAEVPAKTNVAAHVVTVQRKPAPAT